MGRHRHWREHRRRRRAECGPPHGRGHRLWRARAHLRWRVFVWFGIAILAGGAAAGGLMNLSGGRHPVVLVLVGAILWIGAGAIAFSLTRPLMSIVRVTRDLGAGKLDSRLELGRHRGELGILAEAINDMAERIERQLADQRELLAAVSHELRTPLGHLRILLESARERGSDPALIDELEREIVEVDELVSQLLATSRIEFETVQRARVDLGDAARTALERAGDQAPLEVEGDVTCDADPTLIARAMANLIGNAREHGAGVVKLRVAGTGDAVSVEVEDNGSGFTDGENERVFDRFYRGENRAGGSLGLGLSLVRRIAEAHGGTAWAENREQGGARVGFSIAISTS